MGGKSYGIGEKNMDHICYLFTNMLTEEETKIVTSIVRHIEQGDKRIGIQQIASENFASTTSIMKMCKRLGFDGYSQLYYYLTQQIGTCSVTPRKETLASLIDNYTEEQIQKFCTLLNQYRDRKFFASGEGFSNLVSEYFVQRLSICGFMAYRNVHFYDVMLFRQANGDMATNIEPGILFAISQSGEAEPVINDVRQAKQNGFSVISFTRRVDSTLAGLSDMTFSIDAARQTLVGGIPNLFFGHVILTFEELVAAYFQNNPSQ